MDWLAFHLHQGARPNIAGFVGFAEVVDFLGIAAIQRQYIVDDAAQGGC